MTVLFDIFMRQTLTNDFWGLHKNMNCPFPLKVADTYRNVKQNDKVARDCCNEFSKSIFWAGVQEFLFK